LWGLAVAAVVLLVVACSTQSKLSGRAVPLTTTRSQGANARASTTSTTTTEPPTTTTTTLVVVPGVDPVLEKQVWDAFVAAYDSIDFAAADPVNRAGAINDHLTNAMLESWQTQIAEYAKEGESARYPAGSTHGSRLYGVTVRNPSWVDLEFCDYDDEVLSVTATGAVVDDSKSYLRGTATMWLQDGSWRLAGQDGDEVERSKCPGF
jgi:hypothetical protein